MPTDANKNGGSHEIELSEAENELYDRQIRLWGLESQKRLRTAKILIAGLNGLGAEITKNIILSGVNSVKLLDDKLVTEEDFCSQFLAPRTALNKNRAEASLERAQALNPMVEISADTEPLASKEKSYFAQFDVVVVIGENNKELLRIDNICRDLGVKFIASDVWGTFGFHFADYQTHQYIEEIFKHIESGDKKKKIELASIPVQREITYPPYSDVISFDITGAEANFKMNIRRNGPAFLILRVLQEFRKTENRDPNYKSREDDIAALVRIRDEQQIDSSVLKNSAFEVLFGQISPAAAIVGGVVAQEIIKVVTKVEEPYRNLFLFDPEKCVGFVETIGVN